MNGARAFAPGLQYSCPDVCLWVAPDAIVAMKPKGGKALWTIECEPVIGLSMVMTRSIKALLFVSKGNIFNLTAAG